VRKGAKKKSNASPPNKENSILYFSQDITKAEQDLEWCKPLLQPSCTSSTTSSTSSIPIKKTVRKNVSATKNGRNTTSVQKTASVQKETDTTKSRIATAVPKKIPKPATVSFFLSRDIFFFFFFYLYFILEYHHPYLYKTAHQGTSNKSTSDKSTSSKNP
jgi:hypothetical protein